jgi:hypothetical protein
MMQARWEAGETLRRSWEYLHQIGVAVENILACLPNPLPPDSQFEEHLFECLH